MSDQDMAGPDAGTIEDAGSGVTVLEVFLRAGIPEERVREHLAAGRIVADGHQVGDLATLVQRPGTVGVGTADTPGADSQ